MESINKLLVLIIIIISITFGFTMCYVIHMFNEIFTKKDLVNLSSQELISLSGKSIISIDHPYNECIKLLIDQANKENIHFEQEKAKSVCFELLEKKNMNLGNEK